MFSLTMRALWIPLRDILDVIKIFWPLILLTGLAATGFLYVMDRFTELTASLETGNFTSDDIIEFLSYITVIFIFAIYATLLLFDGIIKWHRKLILDEPARMISLWPKYKSWSYFGYSILIGLVMAGIGILLSAVSYNFILQPIISAAVENQSGSSPNIDQLTHKIFLAGFIFGFAMIIMVIFLASFLIKHFVLKLPKVAVEEKGYTLKREVTKSLVRGISWPLSLFFVTILPVLVLMCFLLVLISTGLLTVFELAGNEHFKNPWGIAYETLNYVSQIYGPLAFATLLSLFYRERVRPALAQ